MPIQWTTGIRFRSLSGLYMALRDENTQLYDSLVEDYASASDHNGDSNLTHFDYWVLGWAAHHGHYHKDLPGIERIRHV